MKKELNKKQIRKNLSCDLIFIKSVFYQIVSSKVLKNLRVKYVLVMYVCNKSNLRSPNKLPGKILM